MNPDPWAAAVFAATFLLLAAGRAGGFPLPRGYTALAGGLLTALLYGMTWRVVDWDVIALLAGLMVLAGLAEGAGLFAGVRRRLLRRSPAGALWLAILLVSAASAVLLNDAAVVVLVPFLIPLLRAQGLPLPASVALLAMASNVGSLLTPFGNPQNAALASHAGLGLVDFLRVQGPIALVGLLCLGCISRVVARRAAPHPEPIAPMASRGRKRVVLILLLFLGLAAAEALSIGVSALACALLAYGALRPGGGRELDLAVWRKFDWGVMALFLGLYALTAGLPHWLPPQWVRLGDLSAAAATGLTLLFSNVVGNVPAVLSFMQMDPTWTRLHAPFLVTVSTVGGGMLLTGSAAALLACDQARRHGVEVGFWQFAKMGIWLSPVLVLGAILTWGAAP